MLACSVPVDDDAAMDAAGATRRDNAIQPFTRLVFSAAALDRLAGLVPHLSTTLDLLGKSYCSTKKIE